MTTTMATNATIRPATPDDLPQIERLLTASDLPVAGVREALRDFFVADAGGEIVGVAGLEVRTSNALLRSVAVRPEWRSKGVGRALVRHAIDSAEDRGLHALYLLTTTAERYFPHFGFEAIGREHVPDDIRSTDEYSTICASTSTVMRRGLGR